MTKNTISFRQGDVLIIPVSSIPANLKSDAPAKVILAYGEVSGHHHRFENGERRVTSFYKEGDAEMGVPQISGGARLRGSATAVEFIKVSALGADLVHEEHSTIHVPAGDYKIVRQREFDMMEGVRAVAD
jgi:hypothetical protein